MLSWLLPLCVALDVGRELCFKKCTIALERSATPAQVRGTQLQSQHAIAWGTAGASVWLCEILLYALVLTTLALNKAFPILSLTYAATPVAAWLVLGEHIQPKRWLGILLVTLGVATIAATGIH
jgi:drug/metabolite transporter (DMT)-like permease